MYTPGIGTFITGPGGGNGLDNGTNYSLKTYNAATQLFENVTSTNVSLSAPTGSAGNKGYFLFVPGDRNPNNLTPPNTNITTLSSKGKLQIGTQTFTASGVAANYTLIGNPYASPVDFSLLRRTNLANRFYAWDPTLNTAGGYVLVDDFNNTGTYSITPLSSQTKVLQSSQAFFVQTLNSAAASLEFNESNKSALTSNTGFRTDNGSDEVLRTSLYLKNTDTAILADGVLSEFNYIFSPAVNMEDGSKMENINENLAILRDGHLLAIERRPFADNNDTLFLNLTNINTRDYRFRFDPSNITSVIAAWLEDTYTKTQTTLSLTASTLVDFSAAANTASALANRFRIVFKTYGTVGGGGVLPLSYTTVKAYQQNTGIQVEWNIATENNIDHYEVEKSANGNDFKKLSTATAKDNNNVAAGYTWFDANPFNGNNFYRIKAVDKSGHVKYSEVVVVKVGNGRADIVIYPNPVKEGTLNIQLNNEPQGTYIIQLFNSLGQQLLTKTIVHAGGSAAQTIKLSSTVSKGIYQLQVTNGETKKTQQIIVQ